MTNPQHYPQWWKIESISLKVRNKARVPTLTTIIQHSVGSVGHSNQGRKRNKRNPDRKRRSKTLTVCKTTWSSTSVQFSSVQFSHSVMSNSLRPHELQHARPPCPSPTPGVYSNSCPSSQWCHLGISSSVVPFSCPQPLPASGSFPMSQLFA